MSEYLSEMDSFYNLILESADDLTVGIFWYYKDNVEIESIEHVSKSSNIFKVSSDEIFINPHKDHIGIWYSNPMKKIVKPEIINKYGNVAHNHYPRGRVTYYVNKSTREQYYLVLMDQCLFQNKAVQSKVKAAFNLSGNRIEFETDSHYICNLCQK